MKATKTFKIGEYAKGGVITAEVNDKQITIIGKDWDMSAGTRRSSNQSNAKEFQRNTFNADNSNVRMGLFMCLTDLTSSYYADEIIKWVETKVKLNNSW
jgi:hypothetical protein